MNQNSDSNNNSSPQSIIQIPGYTFYRHKDHPSNDIKYVTQSTNLEELKEECEKYDYSMGFNTLGWIKYSIDTNNLVNLYGASKYEDGIYLRDMSSLIQSRIDKLVQIKNDPERDSKTYDLTFTITTCKRFNLFKKTMDMILINYANMDKIREFICVDDNSSASDREAMMEAYPFFTYIMKNESEKGHPKSMNIIMDSVKTKYNIHFEDDWSCNKPFDIKALMDSVIKNNFDILILRKICWEDTNIVGYIKDEPVREYIYNGNHAYKPELNREYDEETYPDKLGSDNPDRMFAAHKYWWWPGFTLNPSIINFERIKQIGYYKQDILPELFEYDFALRCYYDGIKVYYINLNIEHTGTVISSYSLNDMKRYYDK